ncbi:MAG: methyltransferase domain-containing protein [Rhodothermales bacterium]
MKRTASATSTRTLGPVDDLEPFVPAEWWRALFGSTYLLTDADVMDASVTEMETSRFIELLQLLPDESVLDLCCGHGRHAIELARRGYSRVEGLDRSRYLIRKAREAARREGLSMRFREGDSRRLSYPARTFDAVLLAGNSFGYFDSREENLKVLQESGRVLKENGRLLLDVVDANYLREHFAPRSWEWLDARHFVCRERTLSEDGSRLFSREVITNTEEGVLADQFYAECLFNDEELRSLLEEAGFEDVEPAGSHAPPSQRMQDTGMMGHRTIFTARRGRRVSAADTRHAARKRHVAVVMGDPRLPDDMKLGGVFDEDDFYTIDQLREALRSLDGYEITYVDDHAKLVDRIKELSDLDFVLNLCDEGYMNDPRKEMHVPALLDVAGVPYSGAGPQCLAFCYDKSLVRGVAREMGIPVPEARFVRPGTSTIDLVDVGYPVIVKPNSGDCSVGITAQSVAYTPDDLAVSLKTVRSQVGTHRPLLVEEFLTGKDLTIGIIGNAAGGYTVLPVTEDDYSGLPPDLPPICGYEAKWLPESPYMLDVQTVLADISDATRGLIEECSIALFERLGCRDYARFDWRLDAAGHPRLLEANPNPGWCWDGHLAKQAAFAGHSYSDMLQRILDAAERRVRPGVAVAA